MMSRDRSDDASSPREWSRRLEEHIRLACLLEANARKPGNVHPGARFADLSHRDLIRAADIVAPALAAAHRQGVGPCVLDAVTRTQNVLRKNANLGIILLLAPLAAVAPEETLPAGIPTVLAALDQTDAVLVYRAIRLAGPAGMGTVSEQDLSQEPEVTLLEAMRLAEKRDAVAAEYVHRFDLVLNFGLPILSQCEDFQATWEMTIIELQLKLLSRRPDSLIARKCGMATAQEAATLAQRVLEAGWPRTPAGQELLQQFDCWLRDDGHRRNPGTTADLVAACLFAGLRDGHITPPNSVRWPGGDPGP